MKAKPGDEFGLWTVESISGRHKTRRLLIYRCKCKCGNVKDVLGIYLGKKSNSCGCILRQQMSKRARESTRGRIVGNRYGSTVVISGYGNGCFECICDCGMIKSVEFSSLNDLNSCGKCTIPQRLGSRRTPEFGIWQRMHKRCYDKSHSGYKFYGELGVSVCERWMNFREFYLDVGRRPSANHSLDRHPNPSGNYEPENVRWATRNQQGRNKRNTRLIEHNGQYRCLSEWCEILGLRFDIVRGRLRLGWSFENAIKPGRFNKWNKP